jgi:uncharacterized membrane protein (DUF485 family)
MTSSTPPAARARSAGAGDGSGTGGSTHHPEIDWVAAQRSPEFRELVNRRRSFVVPVLAFVFIWYFGFIALAGYAPDFMGERLIEGFTVGYALALTQFLMTWYLGWLYLRRSDRVFDPLAKRAAERAVAISESAHHGVGDGDDARSDRRTAGDGERRQ